MNEHWIPFEWVWSSVRVDWLSVGITVVGATAIGFLWARNQYPRWLERAMARKKERETVAQLVSDALQDACHKGQIPPSVWHKYNKKLARSLNLPDMMPKEKKFVFDGIGLRDIAAPNKHFVEFALKNLISQRLHGMGVNVVESIKNMRSRPTKQLIRRSKIKPLPLP